MQKTLKTKSQGGDNETEENTVHNGRFSLVQNCINLLTSGNYFIEPVQPV